MTTNYIIDTGAGPPPERAPPQPNLTGDQQHDQNSTTAAQREERATRRKQDAIAQIQRLAKEQGLNVKIDKPKRRRGRPPKAKPLHS